MQKNLTELDRENHVVLHGEDLVLHGEDLVLFYSKAFGRYLLRGKA